MNIQWLLYEIVWEDRFLKHVVIASIVSGLVALSLTACNKPQEAHSATSESTFASSLEATPPVSAPAPTDIVTVIEGELRPVAALHQSNGGIVPICAKLSAARQALVQKIQSSRL